MKNRKRRLAADAGSAHDRERDEDSMSPEIRRLAIAWGGPHEVASHVRLEEGESEVD